MQGRQEGVRLTRKTFSSEWSTDGMPSEVSGFLQIPEKDLKGLNRLDSGDRTMSYHDLMKMFFLTSYSSPDAVFRQIAIKSFNKDSF